MKKKADSIKDITASNTQADPEVDTAALLKAAPQSPMPELVKPMLATLVDAPFDDPDWQYEVKWDGFRTLAYIRNGEAELLSRNNKSFSEKYYPLHQLMQRWKFEAVLDGEILVLNASGVSKFGSLQNWRSEADGALVYYVFDLLWYQGKNLM
jgi:bifunctional non-homologous end joining protein LigD